MLPGGREEIMFVGMRYGGFDKVGKGLSDGLGNVDGFERRIYDIYDHCCMELGAAGLVFPSGCRPDFPTSHSPPKGA
jgi:hypothetical protein